MPLAPRMLLALPCLALLACGPTTQPGALVPASHPIEPGDVSLCGGARIRVEVVQPNAFLVLDRSASMASSTSGDGTRRWDDLKSAISNLVSTFNNEVHFGMSLFSRGNNCDPGIIDVPLGARSGASLLKELDASSPGGTTPTAATLEYVRQHAGLNDPLTPNVVILATDGSANCSDTDVAGKIAALYNSVPPVRTFVIGIDDEFSADPGLLDSWAIAGHTDRPGPVKYYPSYSAEELKSAFEGIVGGLTTCSFVVPTLPPDPKKVSVSMAGNKLSRDTDNGFVYLTADHSFTLNGSACQLFKSDPAQTIDIEYGCPDNEPVL